MSMCALAVQENTASPSAVRGRGEGQSQVLESWDSSNLNYCYSVLGQLLVYDVMS